MRSLRSPLPMRICVRRLLWLGFAFLRVVQAGGEDFHRLRFVGVLAASVLAFDHHACGQVGDADGGIGFIDVLPARAGCAEGVDAKVGWVQFDVFQFVRFGHDGNGAGGGVDAALAFGGGDALHAVSARFKFQTAVRPGADNTGDDFFIAAQFAFVGGHDFNLPTVALGVAAVHTQQIAGKQRGFVAARSGAYFDEDVFVVVGIFGQQQFLQFGIEFADFGFGRFDFFGGKIFHFGVGQHFFGICQVALGKPIVLEYFDDGVSSACSRVSLR